MKYDKSVFTEGGIKVKKTLFIILALILVLGFSVGCGNDNDGDADDANGAAVITDADADDDDDEVLRGQAGFVADSLIAGMAGVSLEDLNIIDEDDEEGSYRGSSVPREDLVSFSE